MIETTIIDGANIMNIENIPKADAALVAAVSNVNERELKLSGLFERGATQESVIADLALRRAEKSNNEYFITSTTGTKRWRARNMEPMSLE